MFEIHFCFSTFVFKCRSLLIFLCIYFLVPQLGTCVAKDANPAANITWLKNKTPLVAGEKGVYSSFCRMTIDANITAL